MNKLFLFIGLTFALSLPLLWGRVGAQKPTAPKKITATLVSALEAKKMIDENQVFLLDVHTPEQTHIPGTDYFIPFDQIEANIGKLPTDKSTPILVYCRSGSMSQIASEKLIDLGYSSIYDLEGGTNAFKEVNAEVVITPASRSLSEVVYGEVKETEFTLTNYSPAPLRITRVSTSCGCTKAETAVKELKPYEATIIKVTFDPAVHKDDTDLGEVTRNIFVETDNPNFPKLTADIQAVVIKNQKTNE